MLLSSLKSFLVNKLHLWFLLRFSLKTSYNQKLATFVKNIFGFYPENIFLYELAFRHKSKAVVNRGIKKTNERLEYLGDAILGAVIADYLFKKFPNKEEGFLTEMRSKMVSREHLNKLSHRLGFSNFVRADVHASNFNRSLEGDAFEAFIGALYLDKGYRFTRKIILKKIISCHVDIESLMNTEINFKSKVIEWGQKEKHEIEFRMVEEVGNGYGKHYVVYLLVDQQKVSSGEDYSIKKAEQNAAANFLQNDVVAQ